MKNRTPCLLLTTLYVLSLDPTLAQQNNNANANNNKNNNNGGASKQNPSQRKPHPPHLNPHHNHPPPPFHGGRPGRHNIFDGLLFRPPQGPENKQGPANLPPSKQKQNRNGVGGPKPQLPPPLPQALRLSAPNNNNNKNKNSKNNRRPKKVPRQAGPPPPPNGRHRPPLPHPPPRPLKSPPPGPPRIILRPHGGPLGGIGPHLPPPPQRHRPPPPPHHHHHNNNKNKRLPPQPLPPVIQHQQQQQQQQPGPPPNVQFSLNLASPATQVPSSTNGNLRHLEVISAPISGIPASSASSSPTTEKSSSSSTSPSTVLVIDELKRDVPTVSSPTSSSSTASSTQNPPFISSSPVVFIRPVGSKETTPQTVSSRGNNKNNNNNDNNPFITAGSDNNNNNDEENLDSNGLNSDSNEKDDYDAHHYHHHGHHGHHHDKKNKNEGLVPPGFKVQPRGHHSGPILLNKIPARAFQAAQKEEEEEEESSEVYFARINAAGDKIAQAAALFGLHKRPRLEEDDNDLLVGASSNRRVTYQSLDGEGDEEDEDHGHHHHHHHASRRIDADDVLQMVDCGGSDLGFCDMSANYPGHMMGNIMSECQEAVYRGFVPIPEDLELLGGAADEFGIGGGFSTGAKYSNSSKSSVRAKQGSWSWKPYKYKKRQICDSELRLIRPGYARDSTGEWRVVVQTEDLPQRVAIDLCRSPGKPCHAMSDCGRKSRCVQRYNFQHLLAVDPNNMHQCPTIRAFKFPSSCVCHIEIEEHEFY